MTDVIDSVTEIITPPTQADTISPDPNTDIVQTTCAILNLTLHTKLEILTELTTNLTTLFKSLAESIQIQYPIPNTQQITNKTPQLNCAKTCIHICHLLNEKIPTPDPSEKFICQELIDTLSGIAASTRH